MSLFEFAIVAAVIGLLAVLLLQRLAETASDARRVQLRMAAESLRLNVAVLQSRCGQALDVACWNRLLAGRQQASLRERSAPAPTASPADASPFGLLRSAALAAGLDEGWDWLQPDAGRLQLSPRGVAHCRLELAWTPANAAVQVRTLEDRC